MRMLKYKLELYEDGYMVASGDMHGDINRIDGAECLPIQLTMLKLHKGRRNVHDLGDCVNPEEFKFGGIENHSADFRANYRKILQGKHSDCWYLYAFTVTSGHVVLEYHQRETRCSEVVTLPGWDDVGLELQFIVPHRRKKANSKYIVQLSPEHRNTHVSEFVGDVRREIDIYQEKDDDSTFPTSYAIISEFVDP